MDNTFAGPLWRHNCKTGERVFYNRLHFTASGTYAAKIYILSNLVSRKFKGLRFFGGLFWTGPPGAKCTPSLSATLIRLPTSRLPFSNARLKAQCHLLSNVILCCCQYMTNNVISFLTIILINIPKLKIRLIRPTYVIYWAHSRTQSPSYARCDEGLWPNP
jgi:hypothetical protein